MKNNSRRNFIKQSVMATAGITILSSPVVSCLGHPTPSNHLNTTGADVSDIPDIFDTNAPLPDGASPDVWSLDGAWRQTTPTRERISLNGLWGFRPVLPDETPERPPVPDDGWGWCKVPAIWPGRRDRDQAQRIWFASQIEKNAPDFDQAWYKRIFTLPHTFSGKRVILDFTMLQTHAKAFVDGIYAGELWFPGGGLDLTPALTPGKKHEITLLITARPYDMMTGAFMTPERIRSTTTTVRFRGITGDLYLTAMPPAARLDDAQVITSTRDGSITFVVETAGLADRPYRLCAEVNGCGEHKTFNAKNLTPAPDGVLRFTATWKNAKRWDTHTPANRYSVTLTLLDDAGSTLDVLTPVTFGFRDIRIEGRDFILNGACIHLRAFHNVTMSSYADRANKAAARETCRRLKQYGFNYVIDGSYDSTRRATAYLDGMLEACDEEGILFAFSPPDIVDFSYDLQNAENAGRYRQLARWLIRRVRNHPSVIFYSMSHNCTGYYGDQNPLKIDGIFDMPDTEGASWVKYRRPARLAADIVTAIDPTRPVYHHQSGNLGAMHTVNTYLNWAPRQERSDWLEHWATAGIKPLLFVEWGLPHVSTWSSYRGPEFIWNTRALQSLWASEYGAQFWGDDAYQPTPETCAALAKEEKLWATGDGFAYDNLFYFLRDMTNNYYHVLAYFVDDNWPALRTWGISGLLPWDADSFWLRTNPTNEHPAPGNLENLKRPGIVPDKLLADGLFIDDVNGDPASFTPSIAGNRFLRWNMPDCAYIGGDPAFTDKTHLYHPADTLNKALVILNDRRTLQTVRWHCTLEQDGKALKKISGKTTVPPGGQARVPVTFRLPDRVGDYLLSASFAFEGNITQTDTFRLRTVPLPPSPTFNDPILLYDTKGVTARHFDRLGLPYHKIDNASSIPAERPIVIGRESLDETSVQWIKKPAAGKRLLVMEQTSRQLYDLLGLRIAERGSRLLFLRYPHPITKDLDTEDLRDWTGASTLLSEHLTDIEEIETHNPQWQWCGQTSTRVWRCGNRNNVASVLIEKPAVGDWRALIDGEFDLQYSPLLENIVSDGRIIFCQLDVSGRTTPDPIADQLTICILNELHKPEMPVESRNCIMLGDNARQLGANLGIKKVTTVSLPAQRTHLFVASTGAQIPDNFHRQIYDGSNALCLGMNVEEIARWSPVALEVAFTDAYFTRIEKIPPELYGLSNADWAWHGQMSFHAFPMCPDGNQALRVIRHGKGVIVFWQVPPWLIDEAAKPYLRTTKRRANAMAARLLANLGATPSGFPGTFYLDTPENVDDPYRYYRW